MAGPVFSLLFVFMITSHFKDAWSQHLSLPASFRQQLTNQQQFHDPRQTQFHGQGQGQFQRQGQGQFHSQGQREFHGQSLTGPTNPVLSPYDSIHSGSLRQPGMGQDTGVRNPPLNQFHPQGRPPFSNQVNKPTPPDPRPWFAPDIPTGGGFMDTGPQGQFQGNTGGGGRSPQRQNRNMNMAFHSDRRLVDSHQFVSQNHGRRGNQRHDISRFNQNAALSGSHVISSQSNVAHVDQPFMSPMSGRHMNREAQHSQRQRNGRVNEWQRRRPPSSSSSDIWNAFQNHKDSVSSMKDAFVLDPSVYDKPQQQMPGNGMDQPLGMHSEGRSLTLSDYMGLGQPRGNVALAKDKKSPSVVDPRFAVISSPDQIATMDVSSSLAMHLHQPKRLGPFSRQRQNTQKQQPRQRNFQQERYHQNALNRATPPPKYYDGQPIGYVFDPFVVSGGSDVSLNTEVKVRTGLSPVAKPTEKPPTVQPDLVPDKWDQKANMLTTGISSKNPEVEKTAGNSRTHQIYTGKQNAIGDVIHSPQNVRQSETQLVGEKPLATQNELPSTIPEKSNAVSNLNNKAGGDKAASASNHVTTSAQSYWNSINSGIVRISTADKTNKGQSMTTTQSTEGVNQNKLSTPATITTTMRDLTKTEPKQVFAQAGTLMQEALNRESTTKPTNTEKPVKLDKSIKTVTIASTTVQPKVQLTTQSTQAKDAFNAMNSHKYEKLIASKEPSYPRPTVVQPMYSPVTDPKIEGKIYNVIGIKKTEQTRNSQNTTVIGNQPDNARTTKKDSVQSNKIKSSGIPVSFGGSWTSSPKTSGNEITTKRVEITTDTFTTTMVSTESTTEAIVQQTTEATTKQTTEKVADPTTHFIRESTPATTKKVTNLVVKETEQPTTEATVLTTTPAKATTQPTTETTAQPTTKPTTEPTTEATTKPTTEPTTEPITKPTTEATTKPTTEPTTKPTTEPTTKLTTEPTTKPTTEATTKPTTEATTKPTTEATTKPTTEATTEPTTKPTTEATTTVTTTEPTVKTTIKPTTKQTIRTTESPTTEATTKTTEAITTPAAELGNDPQATYPRLPTAKPVSRFAQPLSNAAKAMVQTEPYLRNTLINQESKVPAVKSEVIESTTESAKIPIEELTTKSPVKQTTVQTPKPTTQLMTSTTTSTKLTRPTTIARSVAHIERASSAFGDYMKPDIKATTQASIASNWRGSFVPLDPAQHVQELHKEQKGLSIQNAKSSNSEVPERIATAAEQAHNSNGVDVNALLMHDYPINGLAYTQSQQNVASDNAQSMQATNNATLHAKLPDKSLQKSGPSTNKADNVVSPIKIPLTEKQFPNSKIMKEEQQSMMGHPDKVSYTENHGVLRTIPKPAGGIHDPTPGRDPTYLYDTELPMASPFEIMPPYYMPSTDSPIDIKRLSTATATVTNPFKSNVYFNPYAGIIDHISFGHNNWPYLGNIAKTKPNKQTKIVKDSESFPKSLDRLSTSSTRSLRDRTTTQTKQTKYITKRISSNTGQLMPKQDVTNKDHFMTEQPSFQETSSTDHVFLKTQKSPTISTEKTKSTSIQQNSTQRRNGTPTSSTTSRENVVQDVIEIHNSRPVIPSEKQTTSSYTTYSESRSPTTQNVPGKTTSTSQYETSSTHGQIRNDPPTPYTTPQKDVVHDVVEIHNRSPIIPPEQQTTNSYSESKFPSNQMVPRKVTSPFEKSSTQVPKRNDPPTSITTSRNDVVQDAIELHDKSPLLPIEKQTTDFYATNGESRSPSALNVPGKTTYPFDTSSTQGQRRNDPLTPYTTSQKDVVQDVVEIHSSSPIIPSDQQTSNSYTESKFPSSQIVPRKITSPFDTSSIQVQRRNDPPMSFTTSRKDLVKNVVEIHNSSPKIPSKEQIRDIYASRTLSTPTVPGQTTSPFKTSSTQSQRGNDPPTSFTTSQKDVVQDLVEIHNSSPIIPSEKQTTSSYTTYSESRSPTTQNMPGKTTSQFELSSTQGQRRNDPPTLLTTSQKGVQDVVEIHNSRPLIPSESQTNNYETTFESKPTSTVLRETTSPFETTTAEVQRRNDPPMSFTTSRKDVIQDVVDIHNSSPVIQSEKQTTTSYTTSPESKSPSTQTVRGKTTLFDKLPYYAQVPANTKSVLTIWSPFAKTPVLGENHVQRYMTQNTKPITKMKDAETVREKILSRLQEVATSQKRAFVTKEPSFQETIRMDHLFMPVMRTTEKPSFVDVESSFNKPNPVDTGTLSGQTSVNFGSSVSNTHSEVPNKVSYHSMRMAEALSSNYNGKSSDILGVTEKPSTKVPFVNAISSDSYVKWDKTEATSIYQPKDVLHKEAAPIKLTPLMKDTISESRLPKYTLMGNQIETSKNLPNQRQRDVINQYQTAQTETSSTQETIRSDHLYMMTTKSPSTSQKVSELGVMQSGPTQLNPDPSFSASLPHLPLQALNAQKETNVGVMLPTSVDAKYSGSPSTEQQILQDQFFVTHKGSQETISSGDFGNQITFTTNLPSTSKTTTDRPKEAQSTLNQFHNSPVKDMLPASSPKRPSYNLEGATGIRPTAGKSNLYSDIGSRLSTNDIAMVSQADIQPKIPIEESKRTKLMTESMPTVQYTTLQTQDPMKLETNINTSPPNSIMEDLNTRSGQINQKYSILNQNAQLFQNQQNSESSKYQASNTLPQSESQKLSKEMTSSISQSPQDKFSPMLNRSPEKSPKSTLSSMPSMVSKNIQGNDFFTPQSGYMTTAKMSIDFTNTGPKEYITNKKASDFTSTESRYTTANSVASELSNTESTVGTSNGASDFSNFGLKSTISNNRESAFINTESSTTNSNNLASDLNKSTRADSHFPNAGLMSTMENHAADQLAYVDYTRSGQNKILNDISSSNSATTSKSTGDFITAKPESTMPNNGASDYSTTESKASSLKSMTNNFITQESEFTSTSKLAGDTERKSSTTRKPANDFSMTELEPITTNDAAFKNIKTSTELSGSITTSKQPAVFNDVKFRPTSTTKLASDFPNKGLDSISINDIANDYTKSDSKITTRNSVTLSPTISEPKSTPTELPSSTFAHIRKGTTITGNIASDFSNTDAGYGTANNAAGVLTTTISRFTSGNKGISEYNNSEFKPTTTTKLSNDFPKVMSGSISTNNVANDFTKTDYKTTTRNDATLPPASTESPTATNFQRNAFKGTETRTTSTNNIARELSNTILKSSLSDSVGSTFDKTGSGYVTNSQPSELIDTQFKATTKMDESSYFTNTISRPTATKSPTHSIDTETTANNMASGQFSTNNVANDMSTAMLRSTTQSDKTSDLPISLSRSTKAYGIERNLDNSGFEYTPTNNAPSDFKRTESKPTTTTGMALYLENTESRPTSTVQLISTSADTETRTTATNNLARDLSNTELKPTSTSHVESVFRTAGPLSTVGRVDTSIDVTNGKTRPTTSSQQVIGFIKPGSGSVMTDVQSDFSTTVSKPSKTINIETYITDTGSRTTSRAFYSAGSSPPTINDVASESSPTSVTSSTTRESNDVGDFTNTGQMRKVTSRLTNYKSSLGREVASGVTNNEFSTTKDVVNDLSNYNTLSTAGTTTMDVTYTAPRSTTAGIEPVNDLIGVGANSQVNYNIPLSSNDRLVMTGTQVYPTKSVTRTTTRLVSNVTPNRHNANIMTTSLLKGSLTAKGTLDTTEQGQIGYVNKGIETDKLVTKNLLHKGQQESTNYAEQFVTEQPAIQDTSKLDAMYTSASAQSKITKEPLTTNGKLNEPRLMLTTRTISHIYPNRERLSESQHLWNVLEEKTLTGSNNVLNDQITSKKGQMRSSLKSDLNKVSATSSGDAMDNVALEDWQTISNTKSSILTNEPRKGESSVDAFSTKSTYLPSTSKYEIIPTRFNNIAGTESTTVNSTKSPTEKTTIRQSDTTTTLKGVTEKDKGVTKKDGIAFEQSVKDSLVDQALKQTTENHNILQRPTPFTADIDSRLKQEMSILKVENIGNQNTNNYNNQISEKKKMNTLGNKSNNKHQMLKQKQMPVQPKASTKQPSNNGWQLLNSNRYSVANKQNIAENVAPLTPQIPKHTERYFKRDRKNRHKIDRNISIVPKLNFVDPQMSNQISKILKSLYLRSKSGKSPSAGHSNVNFIDPQFLNPIYNAIIGNKRKQKLPAAAAASTPPDQRLKIKYTLDPIENADSASLKYNSPLVNTGLSRDTYTQTKLEITNNQSTKPNRLSRSNRGTSKKDEIQNQDFMSYHRPLYMSIEREATPDPFIGKGNDFGFEPSEVVASTSKPNLDSTGTAENLSLLQGYKSVGSMIDYRPVDDPNTVFTKKDMKSFDQKKTYMPKLAPKKSIPKEPQTSQKIPLFAQGHYIFQSNYNPMEYNFDLVDLFRKLSSSAQNPRVKLEALKSQYRYPLRMRYGERSGLSMQRTNIHVPLVSLKNTGGNRRVKPRLAPAVTFKNNGRYAVLDTLKPLSNVLSSKSHSERKSKDDSVGYRNIETNDPLINHNSPDNSGNYDTRFKSNALDLSDKEKSMSRNLDIGGYRQVLPFVKSNINFNGPSLTENSFYPSASASFQEKSEIKQTNELDTMKSTTTHKSFNQYKHYPTNPPATEKIILVDDSAIVKDDSDSAQYGGKVVAAYESTVSTTSPNLAPLSRTKVAEMEVTRDVVKPTVTKDVNYYSGDNNFVTKANVIQSTKNSHLTDQQYLQTKSNVNNKFDVTNSLSNTDLKESYVKDKMNSPQNYNINSLSTVKSTLPYKSSDAEIHTENNEIKTVLDQEQKSEISSQSYNENQNMEFNKENMKFVSAGTEQSMPEYKSHHVTDQQTYTKSPQVNIQTTQEKAPDTILVSQQSISNVNAVGYRVMSNSPSSPAPDHSYTKNTNIMHSSDQNLKSYDQLQWSTSGSPPEDITASYDTYTTVDINKIDTSENTMPSTTTPDPTTQVTQSSITYELLQETDKQSKGHIMEASTYDGITPKLSGTLPGLENALNTSMDEKVLSSSGYETVNDSKNSSLSEVSMLDESQLKTADNVKQKNENQQTVLLLTDETNAIPAFVADTISKVNMVYHSPHTVDNNALPIQTYSEDKHQEVSQTDRISSLSTQAMTADTNITELTTDQNTSVLETSTTSAFDNRSGDSGMSNNSVQVLDQNITDITQETYTLENTVTDVPTTSHPFDVVGIESHKNIVYPTSSVQPYDGPGTSQLVTEKDAVPPTTIPPSEPQFISSDYLYIAAGTTTEATTTSESPDSTLPHDREMGTQYPVVDRESSTMSNLLEPSQHRPDSTASEIRNNDGAYAGSINATDTFEVQYQGITNNITEQSRTHESLSSSTSSLDVSKTIPVMETMTIYENSVSQKAPTEKPIKNIETTTANYKFPTTVSPTEQETLRTDHLYMPIIRTKELNLPETTSVVQDGYQAYTAEPMKNLAQSAKYSGKEPYSDIKIVQQGQKHMIQVPVVRNDVVEAIPKRLMTLSLNREARTTEPSILTTADSKTKLDNIVLEKTGTFDSKKKTDIQYVIPDVDKAIPDIHQNLGVEFSPKTTVSIDQNINEISKLTIEHQFKTSVKPLGISVHTENKDSNLPHPTDSSKRTTTQENMSVILAQREIQKQSNKLELVPTIISNNQKIRYESTKSPVPRESVRSDHLYLAFMEPSAVSTTTETITTESTPKTTKVTEIKEQPLTTIEAVSSTTATTTTPSKTEPAVLETITTTQVPSSTDSVPLTTQKPTTSTTQELSTTESTPPITTSTDKLSTTYMTILQQDPLTAMPQQFHSNTPAGSELLEPVTTTRQYATTPNQGAAKSHIKASYTSALSAAGPSHGRKFMQTTMVPIVSEANNVVLNKFTNSPPAASLLDLSNRITSPSTSPAPSELSSDVTKTTTVTPNKARVTPSVIQDAQTTRRPVKHQTTTGAPIIDGALNNNPVISQVTPSRPLNAVEPPNPTFDAGTNEQKLGVSSGQGMTETFGGANMQGFHRQLIHQGLQQQEIQKTDPSPVANNPSNPSGMIKDNNPSVANTGLVAVPSTVNQEGPHKPLATNPNAIPAHAWQTQANTNMAAAGNQFVPGSPLTSSTGGNEPVASGQPSNSQIPQAPPLDAQQPGSMVPKAVPKQFTFPGMNKDVNIPGHLPVQPTEPLQSSAAAPLIDATVEKVKTQPLNKNVHAPTDFNTGLNTFNNQPLNNLQTQHSAPVHANTGVQKHGNNALPEYAVSQTGTAAQTSNVEPLFSNSNQQGSVGGSNSNPQQPVFNYIPPNGTPPPSSTIAVQVDPYINVQDQLSTNNPNTVDQMSGMIISAGNGQYPMESIPPGQHGTASMLGMAASVTPSSVSAPSVGPGYIGTESVVYPTNPVAADLLTTTVAATTTQSPQPSSAASERRQKMIDALVFKLNNLQKGKPQSQQRVITAAKLSTLRDDALIRLSTKLGLSIPTATAAKTTPKPTIRTPSRRRGRTRSRLRTRTRSRGNRGRLRVRG